MAIRTFEFVRDDSFAGFSSAQRPSTDALDAIILAARDIEGLNWLELSDQDDSNPKFTVTYATDDSIRRFSEMLQETVRKTGVEMVPQA